MPQLQTIPRAFVSYAHADKAFVHRLTADLRKSGVEVWVDFEGLQPGTRDWETAIREAMAESFAVLLIASPNSRQSSYVRAELLLADALKLPIFAIWAAGEEWIDSVPMSLAYIQYQDFRDSAYDDSFRVLKQNFAAFGPALPTHFIYESFYEKVVPGDRKYRSRRQYRGGGLNYEVYEKNRPVDLMEICLVDAVRGLRDRTHVDTLFVNPKAFKTAAHLLDQVYMNYLSDRFPRCSYGRMWHLSRGERGSFRQLAIDWRFLGENVDENAASVLGMDGAPGDYGLTPGSVWILREGMPEHTITIAAYDEWMIQTILTNQKASSLMMNRFMRPATSDELQRSHWGVVAVVTHIQDSDVRTDPRNRIFVQAEDCPEDVKKRWTY